MHALRVIGVGIGLCAVLLGCFRQEFETHTIVVPQMKAPACSDMIIERLKRIRGVKHVALEGQNVLVTFNSTVVALKNIEISIAELGFTANEIAADAKATAALPAPCKEAVEKLR